MIKISLTNEQIRQLKPCFEKSADAFEKGGLAGIAAQIFEDGMIVAVLENEKARALRKAIKGDDKIELIRSAQDKIG